MNSTVQRPVIVRVCWSSSPGQTTTWIESARISPAIIGELVTSVSSYGGAAASVGASASAVDDASRKIVEPLATSVAASRGDRRLGRRRLRRSGAPTPSGARARDAGRAPRAAAHALDQPLARELLEVAVRGHVRDRVAARELGDRHAAVAPDPLEDLGPRAMRMRGTAPAHARTAPRPRGAREVLTDSSTSHE